MRQQDKERLFAEFHGNPPADKASIDETVSRLEVRLPEGYVHFLQKMNGGEGFIGDAYAILWNVENLLEMNQAYEVADYAPGLLLFGSDGGGEAFAFDTRAVGMPVVSVPFVGMELKLARLIASDFGSFLEKMFDS